MHIGEFIRKQFKGDKVIWAIFFSLIALSLIEVFSSMSRLTFGSEEYMPKIISHFKFLLGGVCVVWITHNLKLSWIKNVTYYVYALAFIALIWAQVSGERINDSARWVNIAGVSFQPLEIAKMGVIMITALLLAKHQTDRGTEKKAFWFILLFAIPPTTLIFLDNLSTAVILSVTIYLMMLIGRVSGKYLSILGGSIVFIGVVGLTVILSVDDSAKEGNAFERKMLTWRNRMINSESTDVTQSPKDYQIDKYAQRGYSRIAIASSGIIGKGPGNSVQRDNIPHAYNDFIYAVIIEDLGLIGSILLLLAYIIILYRCAKIADACDDPYAVFIVIGVSLMIATQALLHMTISVGNYVTGQPLPLVSLGGTSILINSVYIGIILCVSRYAKKNKAKERKLKLESVQDEKLA